MTAGRVMTVQEKSVRRAAFFFPDSVMAQCPLQASCWLKDAITRQVTKCGHYHGASTGKDGMMVNCGYRGR